MSVGGAVFIVEDVELPSCRVVVVVPTVDEVFRIGVVLLEAGIVVTGSVKLRGVVDVGIVAVVFPAGRVTVVLFGKSVLVTGEGVLV